MAKEKATIQVEAMALARELVPLLVPQLVEALARAGAIDVKRRPIPAPPPSPPRRYWSTKEAAEWHAAAPDHRIAWDEHGEVLSLDDLDERLAPGQRVWQVIGWNESRSRAWLQLDELVAWKPEHGLFEFCRGEGVQPNDTADPTLFERWQAWCVKNPANEYGPIYPWCGRPRRRKRTSG